MGCLKKTGTDALSGDLRKENRTKAENKMNPGTERLELCEAFPPGDQVSSSTSSEEPLSVLPQCFCTLFFTLLIPPPHFNTTFSSQPGGYFIGEAASEPLCYASFHPWTAMLSLLDALRITSTTSVHLLWFIVVYLQD